MPETMPAEVVPFTPGRAALTRASHYAEALAALVEAKATEHEDPDAGPVFVDAVRAFDLNPAAAPCPVTEGRWELALAGLVAEDVGALEVEVMPWPLDEGGEVFRLSARLRGDLAPDQLARLGLWERQARELALVRLGDGLTHCEALAAALDPDAGPDEVTARGGELLRCVRELLALMDKAPRTPRRGLRGPGGAYRRIFPPITRMLEGAQGLDEGAGPALAHYVADCLALLDRVAHLLACFTPSAPADAHT